VRGEAAAIVSDCQALIAKLLGRNYAQDLRDGPRRRTASISDPAIEGRQGGQRDEMGSERAAWIEAPCIASSITDAEFHFIASRLHASFIAPSAIVRHRYAQAIRGACYVY
jgi:hypothetical protein